MTKPTALEQKKILSMSADKYMNGEQADFFKRLLHHESCELISHISYLRSQLERSEQHGDEADKAIREEELRLLFRQIDRESQLLPKFDAALQRIRQGEYGFCRETGEPIGLARLILRPTAELSIDAKIKQERIEALYRK